MLNIKNIYKGKRLVGASTITQQVAKNFLLTNEVSLNRKIKEAILAFRIERALSKERILELYLNQIYLGSGAYGVAAASLEYFDKSIKELNYEEAALLAALPKAPSKYNPYKNIELAKFRRNLVLKNPEVPGADICYCLMYKLSASGPFDRTVMWSLTSDVTLLCWVLSVFSSADPP